MCLDIRSLNQLRIKAKFSTSIIYDLLFELHGDQLFTNMDIRSGYHQIKMKEEDIPKTTFRAHEGHNEFLVIPFGLCNVPSTFKILMNKMLKPYVRAFF